MNKKKILSIIPARSNSKEVKNKNIKLLDGKPLVYYTIKASLESNVTRTIVSTDDTKIAKISKGFGAEVPFLRPKKYALSHSSSISPIIHCINYLKLTENYIPDYVVYLQPTSPFRTSSDIDCGLHKLIKSNYTSLAGIVKVTQHPLWMFKKNNQDKLYEIIKKKDKPQRRQDMPPLYYLNDALYISKIQFFNAASLSQPIIDLNNLIGLEMTPLHSFDINTKLDFDVANNLMKLLSTKSS